MHQFLPNIRAGLAVHDIENILAVNATLCDRLGYTPGQLMGCSPFKFLHLDYHLTGRALAAELVSKPTPAVLLRRNGQSLSVRLQGRQATFRGRPVRLVHLIWDD